MQKITPFLWFEKDMEAAVKLYAEVFEGKAIDDEKHDGTPSGEIEIVTVELWGLSVTLMQAGPHQRLNPSISFMVSCESEAQVEEMWGKLVEGAMVMMELGEYPFNKKYGWLEDRFGVSWQLMVTEGGRKIRPSLLFVKDVAGRAEEAARYYVEVFENSSIDEAGISRYGEGGSEFDAADSVNYLPFELEGMEMVAMDSGAPHEFSFNDAFSFLVSCVDQGEVDYFWEKLLEGGGKENDCGWLEDRYGVRWQIVPKRLEELLREDRTGKVMQVMLKMKKLVIADLEAAAKE